MNTLVLGIGNILMNDDGAGVLVAQELQERYKELPENIKVIDGGTLGLDLLPYVEWADKMILIDSVDLELDPGTVVRIEGEDIDPVFESKLSVHQMGTKDLILTAELQGHRPDEIVFFGIQTENVNFDMELSEKVASNMKKLLKVTEDELKKHL